MRILARFLGFSVMAAVMLVPSAWPVAASMLEPQHTQLVSVSSTGAVGNSDSVEVSMSVNGRFIAFASRATNLVSTAVSGKQVYLRDLETGAISLVSAAGGAAGNGISRSPSISADGSRIAYISTATNLVGAAKSGVAQAFVFNRDTGETTLASISGGVVPSAANSPILQAAISGDGSAVAFSTGATNLVGAATYSHIQVYKYTLQTRTTTLISVDPSTPDTGSPEDAANPSISGDGQVVAFATVAALSHETRNGYTQVYRRVGGGAVELVSLNAGGTAAARFNSDYPSLSADGNVLAFVSNANDLTDHPTGSGIYWRDIREGVTRLASPSVHSANSGTGDFGNPSISGDGRSVAFVSEAHDLTWDGSGFGSAHQIYVRDLANGVTSLASRADVVADSGDADSFAPSLSGDGKLVAFASYATQLTPATVSNIQVYLRDVTELPGVTRVGGADRYAVSAATSAGTFGQNVPVVYVASGATFPDALSGSAAAGAQHAPVLLVARDSIPAPVVAELQRLTPKKIIVLGGTNSIDNSVQVALAAYAPTVSRISGVDRFDVSAAVSAATFGQGGAPTPVAYVASGAVFPDALSGSAAAGWGEGPVLLVSKDAVPSLIAAELGRLRPGAIVVLGGVNTISDAVVAELMRIAPATRIGGADRFAVSASVSAATFPGGTRTVYVASGAVFPDALAGSAAAIRRAGPVLLVAFDSVPETVETELIRLKPTHIVVLGGPATVSESVLEHLRKYAVPPS